MKTLYKTIKIGLLGTLLAFTSCGYEDPVETSLITDYAVITYEGGNPLFLDLNEPFEETAIATIDGQEVPMDAYYEGLYRGESGETIDTSIADTYIAEYSAVNEEGFVGTQTRKIIVSNTGNLVDNIEGVYLATTQRNGSFTSPEQNYMEMKYVQIWKNDDGTYEISDAFGLYYAVGRAYGNAYLTPGAIIVANDIPSNDFEFPNTVSNISFGGEANITEMTVDADAKTIDFTCMWQADAETLYTFGVHLDQVQF